MSKITFRADDDLVERLEEFDASKSEVMRDALRTYLDDAEREGSSDASLDLIETLLSQSALGPRDPPEITVNVTLDGDAVEASDTTVERGAETTTRKTRDDERDDDGATRHSTCSQCGEEVSSGHVYCPNCGEKSTHRVFCDCGDELRSDWAFCPSCGRRTPAADVLDRA